MIDRTALAYEFGASPPRSRQAPLAAARRHARAVAAEAFEALTYLVEREGLVLDKDELMRAVWPNTFVEENNLTQVISLLRRALGEARGEHRYIATVPDAGISSSPK